MNDSKFKKPDTLEKDSVFSSLDRKYDVSKSDLQRKKNIQLIIFRIKDIEYAVPIDKVQEVVRGKSLKRIPQSPDFVLGIMNLRGNIIPVLGLREKFGLLPIKQDEFTRIIVLRHHDKTLGIMVDEVNKVVNVTEIDFQQNPEITLDNAILPFAEGMVRSNDKIYILLKLDSIMSFTSQTNTP